MYNTPSEKITALFDLFKGRYGSFELKQGQNIGYVQRTWEQAFGRHAWEDLKAAFRAYSGSSRWEKWPSTGDFREVLKEMGLVGNSERDPYSNAPRDWKEDLALFSAWYGSIPLILLEQGCRRDDVLSHFVGAHKGSYAHLCVRAWREGINACWDQAVTDYVEHMAKSKERYDDTVLLFGPNYANSHTLPTPELEAKIAARRAA